LTPRRELQKLGAVALATIREAVERDIALMRCSKPGWQVVIALVDR
jgi:hypothetical protein